MTAESYRKGRDMSEMIGPRIRTIDWVPASGVLGHEAYGFTPWLADNLDLIADALGLSALRLVATEQGLPPFRIDILAVTEDDTDDGIPVVIENQYGRTDHDHLGKVITYLAGQQRGLGIWVAESFADPHMAAVEFLNRTSDGSVGYALILIRLAPAPDGEFYVDLDVVARPNQWLKSLPEAAGSAGSRTPAPARVAFLEAVHERIQGPLVASGWAQVLAHTARSARIQLHLSQDHPLQRVSYHTLRADPTGFRFRHVLRNFGPLEQSREAVRALRDRYADRLAPLLPDGTTVVWDVEVRDNQVNGQWQAEHPGGGYNDLDVDTAAEWAVAVAGAWVKLMREDPPVDIVDRYT